MRVDTKALRVLCPLQWQEKGRHGIYGTKGCEFAQFGILEHSVGPAGFEVYTDREVWISTFWHGNRGHQLGRFASQAEAMEAAQSHADKLVASFAPALLDAADRLDKIERLAETGTAQAFGALSDDDKLRWFVTTGQRDKEVRDRLAEMEAELAEAQSKCADMHTENANLAYEAGKWRFFADNWRLAAGNWQFVAEHLESENERLCGLLGAARCPACDGSGAIPHSPTPDGEWGAQQCQWCDDRKQALAAGGEK